MVMEGLGLAEHARSYAVAEAATEGSTRVAWRVLQDQMVVSTAITLVDSVLILVRSLHP